MEAMVGRAAACVKNVGARSAHPLSYRWRRRWRYFAPVCPLLLCAVATAAGRAWSLSGGPWAISAAQGRLIGQPLEASLGSAAPGRKLQASARTRPAAVGGQGLEGLGSESNSEDGGGSSELGDAEAEDLRLARERLARQFGEGTELGGGSSEDEDTFWAKREWELGTTGLPRAGTVLVAHPKGFFEGLEEEVDEEGWGSLPPAALRTHRMPLRPDAQRRDRANLPVVLITRRSPQGTEGLMLGCWTGRLLGDLDFNQFMTRPLYLGGGHQLPDAKPLSLLHAYPELRGSLRLTPDGLAISDGFHEACDFVDNDIGSPWRFKFFVQRVFWKPGEDETELSPERGVWLPVRCSRDLLLREPDSAYEEPLWVQIAQKAGGELADLGRKYGLFAN